MSNQKFGNCTYYEFIEPFSNLMLLEIESEAQKEMHSFVVPLTKWDDVSWK